VGQVRKSLWKTGSLGGQAAPKPTDNEEDYTLTEKQIEYAFTLLEKVKNEFELAIAPDKLTVKDCFLLPHLYQP
jgi:hypothetical protein